MNGKKGRVFLTGLCLSISRYVVPWALDHMANFAFVSFTLHNLNQHGTRDKRKCMATLNDLDILRELMYRSTYVKQPTHAIERTFREDHKEIRRTGRGRHEATRTRAIIPEEGNRLVSLLRRILASSSAKAPNWSVRLCSRYVRRPIGSGWRTTTFQLQLLGFASRLSLAEALWSGVKLRRQRASACDDRLTSSAHAFLIAPGRRRRNRGGGDRPRTSARK